MILGRVGTAVTILTLLAAAGMDLRTMSVRRWVWAVGGLPVLGLMFGRLFACKQAGELRETVFSCLALLLYWMLQQGLFARMYGRADCHAFCLCAADLWLMGYGFSIWVYQMALAYVLMAVTQALRGNIARTGNLKEPVPFLPYITISLLLIHCITEQKVI